MAQRKGQGAPGASGRRRWWHLRQRWRMLGVFEINQEHEFYSLTAVMKDGLRAATQTSIDTPAPDVLTAEHFEAEETQTHEASEMKTFAGPVFANLRRSLGMTEEEYQSSLSSEGFYLQFVSNSKSKADFFLTQVVEERDRDEQAIDYFAHPEPAMMQVFLHHHPKQNSAKSENDKRFFLKTQSRREVTFLLSNLKAYVDHLEKNPHSLMVRFLGVHRIVIPNQIKKYFIVMQSVFYPDERINIRYDIKGCDVGRWTNPTTEGSQIVKVLKDNNFEGQHISLGHQGSWFVDQVQIDSTFLQGLNVLDYSILLAQQPLHKDELDGKRSFANLIIRTTKSIDVDNSPTEEDPPTIPLLEENSAQVAPDTPDCGSDQPPVTEYSGDGIPLQEINCHTAATSTELELEEFHAYHRRLLPNFQNAVHVIDGPDLRYFVGIIDIFTVYGWKKRLENLWKRMRFPGRAFSTVSPPAYAQRFSQWVQSHSQ